MEHSNYGVEQKIQTKEERKEEWLKDYSKRYNCTIEHAKQTAIYREFCKYVDGSKIYG